MFNTTQSQWRIRALDKREKKTDYQLRNSQAQVSPLRSDPQKCLHRCLLCRRCPDCRPRRRRRQRSRRSWWGLRASIIELMSSTSVRLMPFHSWSFSSLTFVWKKQQRLELGITNFCKEQRTQRFVANSTTGVELEMRQGWWLNATQRTRSKPSQFFSSFRFSPALLSSTSNVWKSKQVMSRLRTRVHSFLTAWRSHPG